MCENENTVDCTGLILNRQTGKANKIKKTLSGSNDPVVTDKVKHAIGLLCEEPTLSALWNIRNFDKDVQGTSPIESLNSKLGTEKHAKVSGTLYDTVFMFISSIIFRHNSRY